MAQYNRLSFIVIYNQVRIMDIILNIQLVKIHRLQEKKNSSSGGTQGITRIALHLSYAHIA